jgi:hypothetical protein
MLLSGLAASANMRDRAIKGSTVNNKKLFISHAAADKPLVKSFVELLEGGVGVPPRDIFCSSLKGQGIKPGTEFKASIREHLDDATCVMALVTPNFYSSAFCMCELGGVWIQAKNFIPIVVPPLTFGDLKAVLSGLQALKVADQADLDQLRDETAERLSISALPTPRWNERRDEFLSSLPSILKHLPAEAMVARGVHEKTLQELDEYKEAYKKGEDELKRLKEMNADLMKIKDPADTAPVVRKHSPDPQTFESLVRSAKYSLAPLSSIVYESLYHRARDEEHYPKGEEEWDEVRRAVEDGQLRLNADENGVSPRESDPKVGKAAAALDELANWLEHPSSDFSDWYAATFEDKRADLRLRPFWKKHLR